MATPTQSGKPPRKSGKGRKSRDKGTSVAALLDIIHKSLDDDQGEEITVIDLAGKTSIADYMIVCSGLNQRHIGAMAEHLKEKIKTAGRPSPPVEGARQSDWVLIDGGDIIIHLFRPESRTIYNLEKLWGGTWTESTESAESTESTNPNGNAAGVTNIDETPPDEANT